MSKLFTITAGLENLGAFRTGGQGSVYKAKRIGEIITAVKLLPTPIHTESVDNKSYNDFKNEVEKLKKVNAVPNPNVVRILSSGLTDSGSFPFIEMEYIDGPDLEDLLKPPNDPIFTIKEAIKVAEHLANALAHCHGVNVKHGDIKSNNVKYNAQTGNYVLLDFGLAIMSDEQRRTSMRQAGAIEFMAPEQSEGIMLVESDIYSFGVVIYELLTGQVPFPLADNGETARNQVRVCHLESPIPDLISTRRLNLPENWSEEKQQLEMRIPPWLSDIVYKCLQKKPSDRFESGLALKEALHQQSIFYSQIKEPWAEHPQTIEEYKEMLAVKERELAQYKDRKTNPFKAAAGTGIVIPLPIFVSLLLLLASLMTFAGYSILRPETSDVLVADIKADSDVTSFETISMISPKIPENFMQNVVLNLDSIKKAEIRERKRARAISRSKREEGPSDDSEEEKPEKEKKKKKKFLDFLF